MQRMQFQVCLETHLLDTHKEETTDIKMRLRGFRGFEMAKYLSIVNSAILDSSESPNLLHTNQRAEGYIHLC